MPEFDHRALLAELSAEKRKALLAQSDGPGLVRLAWHWGAIAAGAAYILAGLPGWQLALVLQGVLIIFLFTTLHETIHRTAFRSDWLNNRVAALCGFLNILPANWFRYFHFAHHRFTHDPDHDPELATAKPRTRLQYLLHVSGLPVWISSLRTLVVNAFRPNADAFVPARGKAKVKREARLHLALYGLLVAGSLWLQTAALFWIWLLPAILGQPFLRLYLLAEHTGCPHVQNMLDNTRTTFTTAFVRLIAWNMPYHVEHHAYPAVPFHRLPQFHQVVKEHIIHSERGYARFNRKLFASLKG